MEHYYQLYNGVKIPKIMIGTYSINGEEAKHIFKAAYNVGYRGVDCGRYYRNEKDWGNAIAGSGVKREDIFIQTKVDYSQEKNGLDVESDFQTTLANFQTDYIDGLLIHWPVFATFQKTWSVLEKLYEQGLVKVIGVSNFRIEHFKLLQQRANIFPMVLQMERHPCRKQQEILNYCKNNNILLEAYQPLAAGRPELMKNELLINIAKNHGCSVPQVALAWNIQSGVIPLPRSKNPERLKANYEAMYVELTEEEMGMIDEDNTHYFRALTEGREFPGYWDEIHRVEIKDYL